jgi:hypothetical protein
VLPVIDAPKPCEELQLPRPAEVAPVRVQAAGER